MEDNLLKKATTGSLENLHNALCQVMSEIKESVPNQRTRISDDDYVKCMSLAADVLREMAERAKKGK